MFQLKGVKYKHILDIDELILLEKRVTCIIGESGSGKTTLLRLLNHLISCDAGEILFKQQNINRLNPVELRRDVVMLPQNPAVFEGNVRENLLIGLLFSDKPPISDEKLYQIMETVCLKKELTDTADKLSGGEKQRLALARVLLLEPEVLLLDEPSSALDEETADKVMGKLVNYIREHGKTLIMITHSKQLAQQYADSLIEINRGRIVR